MKNYWPTLFLLLFVSQLFAQNSAPAPLTGFVDMHTHPRGDLAFGSDLFYGAPCGDISEALKNCRSYHGKNLIRSVLAQQTEQLNNPNWKDGRAGYPDFSTWPAWGAILHQQMWIDWIERAHRGGLNIMVALAVSSHALASAAKTSGPRDDEAVLLRCIQGIKDLAAQSTFMEIALSPQDVRRIVGAGKLAVILGSEMDNIGNFYSPADHSQGSFNANPTNEQIQAELDKLWDLGIRYIFPVHLCNNVFGGSALNLPALNISNKFTTGSEFIPEQVNTAESGICFRLENPSVGLNAVAKMFMPAILPKTVNPARAGNYTFWDTLPGYGHRNSLGITDRGKFAIGYMMHKGFLIDIDHMSEKMTHEVLETALRYNYPVNSGHNGPRGGCGSENGRTTQQYLQIIKTGGMIGVGHSETAPNFVNQYREVVRITGNQNAGIGTDVNGFYPLPKPNPEVHVVYTDSFQRCTTGNRIWDINTDGVAHYGLLPDYLKSCEAAGMTPEEKSVFMNSAEHFTRMWEKCESNRKLIPVY